jgi:hypothetical protein
MMQRTKKRKARLDGVAITAVCAALWACTRSQPSHGKECGEDYRESGAIHLRECVAAEPVVAKSGEGAEVRGDVCVEAWLPGNRGRVAVPFLELAVVPGRDGGKGMREHRVTTDANGCAWLRGLPAGEIAVVPQRGLAGLTKARVAGGHTTRIQVRIEEAVSINGVVVDEDGTPVPNASIEYHSLQKHRPLEVIGCSNDRGAFAIQAVSRLGLVSARAEGHHAVESIRVPGVALERDVLRIPLRRGGRVLEGVVKDVVGNVVPGAVIRVGEPLGMNRAAMLAANRGRHGIAQTEVVTRRDGSFEVRGLRDGDVAVFVKGEHAAPWSGKVGVPGCVNIVLQPGASCMGVATLCSGAPALGTRVSIGADAPWHESFTTVVAGDGTFRLTGLPTGPVTLEARSGSGEVQVRELVGAPGGVARLNLTFNDAAQLRGRVVLEDGSGVAGVTLALLGQGRLASTFERAVTTGDAGGFAFGDLPRGALFTVRVCSPTTARTERKDVDPSAGIVTIVVPDPGSRNGGITGRVVGLTGAEIALTKAGGRSILTIADRDGRFEFGGLFPGRYRIEVKRYGYMTVHSEHDVTEGSVCDVGVVRLEQGGWIGVDVPQRSQPTYKTLQLFVKDRDLRVVSSLKPADGIVQSVLLQPGDYSVELCGANTAASTVPVRVEAGGRAMVAVEPAVGYEVDVTVVLPAGAASSENVRLTLRRERQLVLERLMPRAEGRIRACGVCLAAGDYDVAAATSDGACAGARLTVVQADKDARELVLEIK